MLRVHGNGPESEPGIEDDYPTHVLFRKTRRMLLGRPPPAHTHTHQPDILALKCAQKFSNQPTMLITTMSSSQ